MGIVYEKEGNELKEIEQKTEAEKFTRKAIESKIILAQDELKKWQDRLKKCDDLSIPAIPVNPGK